MTCKFCDVTDSTLALDGKKFDFYLCDECDSYMCHECTITSSKTGKDFCKYCVFNLKYDGRRI